MARAVKSSIRIASGQGFWGDLLTAPVDQVRKGPIDYLVLDYLAEVTMSILQKQRRKDPSLGYARDFVPLVEEILPEILHGDVRVVTNGGGVNPEGCARAIMDAAGRRGGNGVRVGVVTGDDILGKLDDLLGDGIELAHMETGAPLSSVRERVISANVYFGAMPIARALEQGAAVVVTGRTTDTGLTLAPMIAEFGWRPNDWNKMAAGTVAGHILECGGQASGGNFGGDWRSIPDLAHIGFPIVEAHADGTFVVTKHDGTGGRVSRETVSEQLLYEIGDPKMYITPDCVADFTSIQLHELGANRIEVKEITGRPSTEYYKVSIAYSDGYTAFGTLTYAWPDALAKARAADAILRTRLRDLGLEFDEVRTEFQGYDACHGPLSVRIEDPNEVVLRIGVRGKDYRSVERFGKEIAPLILTGPPSVTGFAGGRPKPSEVVAYWPALIPKTAVEPRLQVLVVGETEQEAVRVD
ncbi:MAG TPA: acyclic terpene utilization AtuA family protein [Bacteroidota bacterium]|nr:acyclic terpene utilization AtuA family protein [Bacteroidota bacterium]